MWIRKSCALVCMFHVSLIGWKINKTIYCFHTICKSDIFILWCKIVNWFTSQFYFQLYRYDKNCFVMSEICRSKAQVCMTTTLHIVYFQYAYTNIFTQFYNQIYPRRRNMVKVYDLNWLDNKHALEIGLTL